MAYPFDDENLDNDELGLDMEGEQLANHDVAEQAAYAPTASSLQVKSPVGEQGPTLSFSNAEDQETAVPKPSTLPQIAPQATSAASIQPNGISNVEDLMKQYQDLQKQRASRLQGSAIIDSLSQIGQAIAGRNAPGFKPKSNMDMFEKLANQPVQDFSDRTKQEAINRQLQDIQRGQSASSPEAQQLRKAAEDQGYMVSSDMTADDIKKLFKTYDPDKHQNEKARAHLAEQQSQVASQKVESGDVSLKDAAQMRDPNSKISEFARLTAAKKHGYDQDEIEGMSAWDIGTMMKQDKTSMTSTKLQKGTGTIIDENGKEKRLTASYNPSTGEWKDDSGKLLKGFVQEGLNPFQLTKNARSGEEQVFNKSRGSTPSMVNALPDAAKAQNTKEMWDAIPVKYQDKVAKILIPAFNKETEKTQQRLNHIPVIMARLEEAQHNPAALAQLKAETARFDAGDNRLTQQEFDMFANRHGYKHYSDWLNEHTTGTISKEMADDLAKTYQSTAKNLKSTLNQAAEKQASVLAADLGYGKDKISLIAPHIYGEYQPSMVQVKSKKDGSILMMPFDKADIARQKGLIE